VKALKDKLKDTEMLLADARSEVVRLDFENKNLRRQRSSRPDGAYSLLHLLPSAPAELVEKAYKVLARIYHPDLEGGDEEKMKELNQAYDKLKRR
jgi:DnaJ-class molecular chaperone